MMLPQRVLPAEVQKITGLPHLENKGVGTIVKNRLCSATQDSLVPEVFYFQESCKQSIRKMAALVLSFKCKSGINPE